MSFTDTGFVVRLLSEEDQSYFTIRLLELQNTKVSMQGRRLVNSICLEFQHGFKHCLTSLLPFKCNSMQLKKDCDFRVCNVFLATNQLSHAELCLYNALDQTLCLPQTEESREIYHFHYTTWPDFGVPESPASFLNFLFKVRESGSLDPEHGPSVVHCSAGIGRSGTFALVDTCLVLVRRGVGKCH